MTATNVSRFTSAFCGRTPLFSAALAVATACFAPVQSARAAIISMPLVNASSSVQSRIDVATTATFTGAPLTAGPQFAPGGLNGNGSEASLYTQTASNTPSNLHTAIHLATIEFPGGGTAQAANAVGGLFGNNLAIAPGVGGTTGTAPADYGILLTSPQSTAIPPIDLSALGVSGLGTLNLGTLTAINLNVALRNMVLDLNSAQIPLSVGGGALPATFDSTLLTVGVAGVADMSLTATLQQPDFGSYLAAAAALAVLQQTLSTSGIALTFTTNLLNRSEQIGFGFTVPLPTLAAANSDATQLGKVEHIGSNFRVTVPLNFDLTPTIPAGLSSFVSANFHMSGQLIGQAPFFVVPEPSSIALGAMGLGSVLAVGYRRRRSG